MPQIRPETERAVRDFVRSAVSRLSDALNQTPPEWEANSQWKRGTDGHFREQAKLTRKLWPPLNDEWLRLIPGYDTCIEHLKTDAVVGPHLDRLVGTDSTATRLETGNVLQSAIYAMVNDEGVLAFTDERFDRKWREVVEFFTADNIAFKTVAPIPYLIIPEFPLRLNKEIILDRFADDEVTRCCQVGVLRPQSQRFPLLEADVVVGIRRLRSFPKLIMTGDEPHRQSDASDEGTFGNRPFLREDLTVDDVLSALRIFKHTQVRTAGHASWTDALWLSGGTSYRVLRQWPYGGKYELSKDEVPNLMELWKLLEDGEGRFGFSIHRFNFAFDRGLLADRIVDLIIAAESLFLGDLGVQDRGELRFRFALRAAKFIEHPTYSEHDLFRVMRRAYDARSSIVHGGSPKDTRLPDNESAKLPTFIDAIEEVVRLGLRKALSMKEDGKQLRQSEYWDALVLSKPDRRDCLS